jgi:hypothetical protein
MSAPAPSQEPAVRFARRVFTAAGLVGLVELLPLYFFEATLGRTQPPPVTHPDFYYGFIGVTVAWQLAFLVIARDPLRYRPLMPAIFVEKLLYPLGTWILFAQRRVSAIATPVGASLDFVWLTLFVICWSRLGRVAGGAQG